MGRSSYAEMAKRIGLPREPAGIMPPFPGHIGVPLNQQFGVQPMMAPLPSRNLQYQQRSTHSPNQPLVKMIGLPYSASEKDVQDFFAGYDFLKHSIRIHVDTDGRP